MNDIAKAILFSGVVIVSSMYVTNNAIKQSTYWQQQYNNTEQQMQKISKSRDWYKTRYETLKGKKDGNSH